MEELQELRDLVAQLRAENERLRLEQQTIQSAGTAQVSVAAVADRPSVGEASAETIDRFVFVPRDRKCPKFNGKFGIGISEWVDEVQACIRARCIPVADQAFFLFDHLEGEAREEIRHRSAAERRDPANILAALRELYGCSLSYVALQEAFFSRRQQEGETLLEFSLGLMSLQERVKQQSSTAMPNAEMLLRDQFAEFVLDPALRRELKQYVRRQPMCTFLEVRGEAIRWEREGVPGGARGRSQSLPLVHGVQYGVLGTQNVDAGGPIAKSELGELKDMIMRQQEQLNQLAQGLARVQSPQFQPSVPRRNPVICRRCQRVGHFARDCNGERVLPRVGLSPRAAPVTRGGDSRSFQPTEN